MATCDRCGRHFANKFAFGPHRRVCNVVSVPVAQSSVDFESIPADEIASLTASHSLRDLAQRSTKPSWGISTVLELNQIKPRDNEFAAGRDYSYMQETWLQYVKAAHGCCSSEFWRVQRSLLNQTTVCKDAVVNTVKTLVSHEARQPSWPDSTRALKSLLQRKAGRFWDNVLHTEIIDLSSYELPGVGKIKFEFVDPIYLWLDRANAMYDAGIEMHWKPCSMRHPESHEEVFGAGVQYGLILREASERVPAGSRVALFNLSWDGGSTGFGSRSTVPICVQVMNTNSASAVCIGLVGYLPYVEVSAVYKDHSNYAKARDHVLQTCIGHVLKCINNASRHGFWGNIGPAKMHFFPCLGMLTLDTPERVKYFGLRSMRACGICRLRKGRSVVRQATRHDPEQIEKLYDIACAPTCARYLQVFLNSL